MASVKPALRPVSTPALRAPTHLPVRVPAVTLAGRHGAARGVRAKVGGARLVF